MARDLYRSPKRDLVVTEFSGGRLRGLCVQITTSGDGVGYVQLDHSQAFEVERTLRKWLSYSSDSKGTWSPIPPPRRSSRRRS